MSRHTNDETPRLLRALLERIHKQHHHRKQAALREFFKETPPYVFLYALFILFCALVTFLIALVIFLTQYHIQMYNIIAGPFHLNREQLAKHLEIYKHDQPCFLSRWFSLRREFLQIEIGENQLGRARPWALHVFDDHLKKRMFRASMHHITEPTITHAMNADRFFVRLAIERQWHIDYRLPYRFEAFEIDTLRCAVRHLGVRPSEYLNWVGKSMYVQAIKKRYRENPKLLNTVVAPTCGMLIGYLYRPKGQVAHRPYSKVVYAFHSTDIGFDTYRAYYSYMVLVSVAVVLGCLPLISLVILGCLLLISLVVLILYLTHQVQLLRCVPSSAVEARMDERNSVSLRTLDRLLLGTTEERQYHRRLFIVRELYLVVLHLDWNEDDPDRLEQFYTQSPLAVYSVASITKVVNNGFFVENSSGETLIWLSSVRDKMGESESQWLHGQMMTLSEQYRQR